MTYITIIRGTGCKRKEYRAILHCLRNLSQSFSLSVIHEGDTNTTGISLIPFASGLVWHSIRPDCHSHNLKKFQDYPSLMLCGACQTSGVVLGRHGEHN
jgi:hypothetical protein